MFKGRNVAPITNELASQTLNHLRNRGAIIDIAWRQATREQLASTIDCQVQFEAKEAGLRNRQWNGSSLARLLVFGWLAHPQVGLSLLVAMVRSMGIKTSKQALHAHFTGRKERERKQQKPLNTRTWELCQWTILLTNVPVAQLSVREAVALIRARWKIELLFKLWKS